MKITGLLLFVSVASLFAAETYAQTTKLNLQANNAKISEVLIRIEKQSEFRFFYNEKVDVNKKVTIHVKNKTVFDILDQILDGTEIKYKVIGQQIALFHENNPFNWISTEQQQRSVSGTVTDSEGLPLPGVTVVVKGTTTGTVTNVDGKYFLNNLAGGATLVFSFVGMKTQEIVIGNQTTINLTMEIDAIGIEEVVAIGYGTQRKVNLTGSVVSVSTEELAKRPVSNPTLMLQGKVPGIQIIQNSGAPGNESASIQIRGKRSFGSSSDPLILVDGVQGSLTNLHPDMIESISVLKDASSTAIYGSRAANGVILVTTKKGTANNRLNVEYNLRYGIHNPTFLPELVSNSAEYMEMANEAQMNSWGSLAYTQEEIDAYRNNEGNPQYPNYDWNDYTFRTGSQQSHLLSLNGGSVDGTTFNLAVSYVDQVGVVKKYDSKKTNFLFNMTSKLSKIVTLHTNINLNQSIHNESEDGIRNLILTTFAAQPTFSPRILSGPNAGEYALRAYSRGFGGNRPPSLAAENGGQNYQDNNAHVSTGINIKLSKSLNWETTGAARLNFLSYKNTGIHVPTYDWHTGEYISHIQDKSTGIQVSRRDTKEQFYNIFSTLKYDKLFGEKHQINGLFGYSNENLRNDYLNGYRKLLPSPDVTELNAGSTVGQSSGGNAYEWAIQSIFARGNYAYNDRYLFEVSFRYDGSSRFADGNKWGLFPSFSAGWRISEEDFFSNLGWLDQLKLRASWGQLGNQEIGNYPYQQMMNLGLNYPFGNEAEAGAYLGNLSNENITWETTTITDIGFDITLFDNKFYGTFDYFNKVTSDILRGAQVAGFVGLGAPTINDGEMKNEGIEFLVGHRNTKGDFRYEVSFNLGSYKNTLTKFGEEEDGGTYINREGLPWRSHYTWHQIGIFQTQAEIDAAPVHQFNPQPGDFRYEDVNNDGKIDQDDRIVLPGKYEKFNYGGNISVGWKNLNLSVFIQGSEGRKFQMAWWGFEPFVQNSRPPTFWRNAWTPENPSTTLPRLYYSWSHDAIHNGWLNASSWFYQDASYMRIKNIVLSYDVPKAFCSRIGIRGLQLSYSGDNLFTFTQYLKENTGADKPGGDPERITGPESEYGDFGGKYLANYPQNKIHSFGLKINF